MHVQAWIGPNRHPLKAQKAQITFRKGFVLLKVFLKLNTTEEFRRKTQHRW